MLYTIYNLLYSSSESRQIVFKASSIHWNYSHHHEDSGNILEDDQEFHHAPAEDDEAEEHFKERMLKSLQLSYLYANGV